METVVPGFGDTRKCASGAGRGSSELNQDNDVVTLSVQKISHLRNSQNQVGAPKLLSQGASYL